MRSFLADVPHRAIRATIAIFLLLPIVIFYLLLARAAVDLPFFDDYPAVLDFLNIHVQLPTIGAKALHLLVAQHAEYKLLFENCIFVIERAWLGHVSFLVLMALGNAFVLLIFLLLWRASLVQVAPWRRALLIAPTAYLLFQLQYASTLDWAMGSLQNLPVLFFALLSLWLLPQSGRAFFAAACAAMLLSIASSGNGFVLLLVGALFLFARKAWREVLVWSALGAMALTGYLYHYNFHSSQSISHRGGAVFALIHLSQAEFPLSFLGASVAGTGNVAPAIVLGIALCAGFSWIWKRRYDRINPTLFYCSVFLLFSALGVAAMRGGDGLEVSLVSRYRVYSNLALAVSYLIAVECVLASKYRPRILRMGFIPAIVLSCLFCAASDWAGYRFLQQRSQEVTSEMRAWEHGSDTGKTPDTSTDPILRRHRALGIYRPVPSVLEESERLGVYQPAALP
jgi:hypothetical protein